MKTEFKENKKRLIEALEAAAVIADELCNTIDDLIEYYDDNGNEESSERWQGHADTIYFIEDGIKDFLKDDLKPIR